MNEVWIALIAATASVLSPLVLALLVAHVAKSANVKLDVIHTLVNSNMTASMQNELDATIRELAMMREVVALKKTAGHEPNVETLAAIEATQVKVDELRVSLDDRLKQTDVANEQAKG